jgi:hypothetical protein
VIAWEDEDGKHEVHAALRGPQESRIKSTMTHGMSIDTPNYSLNLLLPNNENTIKYFTRYNKFYLQGYDTCWRIEGVDQFSTPGIIEVSAMEYYSNTLEDDVANGVVGGLIVEPTSPNSAEVDATILGETFIKVKKQYTYTFKGRMVAEWKVDKKYPVKIITDSDPRSITLIWDSTYSG